MLVDDPRTDLTEDSSNWESLLLLANETGGGGPDSLCAALNGVRCMGAQLQLADGRWRIVPGAEYDEAEYARDRERYLLTHREMLVRLLDKLVQPRLVEMA